MHTLDIFALCDRVRETSFGLHRYLRHGHLEKVYENGLAGRLRKSGLPAIVQQHPITVMDEDGSVLGEYFADLLIESRLVVELKACRALTDEHVAQLLGYLRSTLKWTPKVGQRGTVLINPKGTVQHVQETTPA